jgi:hypothetical protein
MTLGLPDSITATQELVVPRSIPMMLNGVLGARGNLPSEGALVGSEELAGGGGASLGLEKSSQHLLCVYRNERK